MPTPDQRRLMLWLPIAAITALGILWLSWPRAVAVDFARVTLGPIEETVSDEGETRVKEAYVVSAPLPGLMQRIALKAGDAVVARQTVMARIEPGDPAFLDRRSAAEARAGVQAAQAATKVKGSYPASLHDRLVSRLGKQRAIVAVANALLEIIYHLLSDETQEYQDLGADYFYRRHQAQQAAYYTRRLAQCGYEVTLTPLEEVA